MTTKKLGAFTKKVEELAAKGRVNIAFGLATPDKEILDCLSKMSEYADITLVGPGAIKDVKGFKLVIDENPEQKIASMLASDEVEGIIRGTIDDFKTADAYKKITGEHFDLNPGLMETPKGDQLFCGLCSNPEGWNKEERFEIAKGIAEFTKKWGVEPKIAVFTGVRHETYKRKKDIKDGVVGILNKTYEDTEWIVSELKKLGYDAKNWSIDLDLAVEDGANVIVPVNGMVGNQLFRAILLSGGRIMAAPRVVCKRPYEDNSRNEKDFSFHVKWLAAWINSKKLNNK
ncbi:MAG: hypothetical protein WC631_00830 [Candidatus Paceibacterota bacterium]|jgi:predicted methyltransferase MtxX (methanogen marker protein 4)